MGTDVQHVMLLIRIVQSGPIEMDLNGYVSVRVDHFYFANLIKNMYKTKLYKNSLNTKDIYKLFIRIK